jgi:hypothetical protein
MYFALSIEFNKHIIIYELGRGMEKQLTLYDPLISKVEQT